jgi:hypothetical protein
LLTALVGALNTFFSNGGIPLLTELAKTKAPLASPQTTSLAPPTPPTSTPSPPPSLSSSPSEFSSPVSSPVPAPVPAPVPVPVPIPVPPQSPIPPEPSPPSEASVQIISSSGSTVPRFTGFRGFVKNLPNDLDMWLYVRGAGEGKYYLQPITTSGDGNWSLDNVIIGSEAKEDVGAEFEIGVVLANASESAEINAKPDQRNDLPGRRVDRITIKRQ